MSYHIRQASLAVMMVCLTAAGGPVVAAEWIYTVQRGDNPWSLTERYLAGIKYWPRIQQLNQITDPEHIPPGTRLRIPVAWLRRTDAVATVAAVNGEVRISGRGRGRAATSGMQLRAGDVVKTARDSNLTLSLPDGSRVLVHAESELHLDDLGMFENTDYYDLRMSVKAGRLENLVAPLGGGPGRFEITTPAAVTAVRGTRYRVSATSTATRTEVTEGAVGVATDGGTVDVPPGFGSVAERGSPPAPPVALLPAPDIAALPALVERVPLRFTVPALPGATAYRVQIATAADFASPLFDGRAENT
ncbi:MAG: FecR domain-containing protein [Gammaproteobacteria bacterium]|nr:FecR domain-containing protein [Gammaproteobacteria bacterium]